MSKKKQRQRMKWKPKQRQVTVQPFYFTVTLADDGAITVNQVPNFPPEHREDNGSLLMIGEAEFALHITWFPAKPPPESDERERGLLAVMKHLHSLVSPEDQAKLARMQFGLGHAYGAKVRFHNEGKG